MCANCRNRFGAICARFADVCRRCASVEADGRLGALRTLLGILDGCPTHRMPRHSAVVGESLEREVVTGFGTTWRFPATGNTPRHSAALFTEAKVSVTGAENAPPCSAAI